MSAATDPNIFNRKPRYLNYRGYELNENFGDAYYYGPPKYSADGTHLLACVDQVTQCRNDGKRRSHRCLVEIMRAAFIGRVLQYLVFAVWPAERFLVGGNNVDTVRQPVGIL